MKEALYRLLLVALALACLSSPALAHRPSDSFLLLDLRGETVSGRWDIALRDLQQLLGLDVNGDLAITWGELKAARTAVVEHALGRLSLRSGAGACALTVTDLRVIRHAGNGYAALVLAGDCPTMAGLILNYGLLFQENPDHRGFLRVRHGAGETTAVLSPDASVLNLAPGATSAWDTARHFWREGVWHIWIGFDHILFLLALLLPTVLWWEAGRWRRADSFRLVLLRVCGIVTAFTVAHSLTLAVATLGWWVPPARWVESIIAATVVLAALNNLYPLVRIRTWRVAFFLGLIHGFGFAGVLGELGLPTQALVLALASFNLGVETGQLAIVLVVLPVAYGLRGTAFYRHGVLRGGSLVTALIAGIWLLERSLAIGLPGL